MGCGVSATLVFHLAGPALATIKMRLLDTTNSKTGCLRDLGSLTMNMIFLGATNSKTGCLRDLDSRTMKMRFSGRPLILKLGVCGI